MPEFEKIFSDWTEAWNNISRSEFDSVLKNTDSLKLTYAQEKEISDLDILFSDASIDQTKKTKKELAILKQTFSQKKVSEWDISDLNIFKEVKNKNWKKIDADLIKYSSMYDRYDYSKIMSLLTMKLLDNSVYDFIEFLKYLKLSDNNQHINNLIYVSIWSNYPSNIVLNVLISYCNRNILENTLNEKNDWTDQILKQVMQLKEIISDTLFVKLISWIALNFIDTYSINWEKISEVYLRMKKEFWSEITFIVFSKYNNKYESNSVLELLNDTFIYEDDPRILSNLIIWNSHYYWNIPTQQYFSRMILNNPANKICDDFEKLTDEAILALLSENNLSFFKNYFTLVWNKLLNWAMRTNNQIPVTIQERLDTYFINYISKRIPISFYKKQYWLLKRPVEKAYYLLKLPYGSMVEEIVSEEEYKLFVSYVVNNQNRKYFRGTSNTMIEFKFFEQYINTCNSLYYWNKKFHEKFEDFYKKEFVKLSWMNYERLKSNCSFLKIKENKDTFSFISPEKYSLLSNEDKNTYIDELGNLLISKWSSVRLTLIRHMMMYMEQETSPELLVKLDYTLYSDNWYFGLKLTERIFIFTEYFELIFKKQAWILIMFFHDNDLNIRNLIREKIDSLIELILNEPVYSRYYFHLITAIWKTFPWINISDLNELNTLKDRYYKESVEWIPIEFVKYLETLGNFNTLSERFEEIPPFSDDQIITLIEKFWISKVIVQSHNLMAISYTEKLGKYILNIWKTQSIEIYEIITLLVVNPIFIELLEEKILIEPERIITELLEYDWWLNKMQWNWTQKIIDIVNNIWSSGSVNDIIRMLEIQKKCFFPVDISYLTHSNISVRSLAIFAIDIEKLDSNDYKEISVIQFIEILIHIMNNDDAWYVRKTATKKFNEFSDRKLKSLGYDKSQVILTSVSKERYNTKSLGEKIHTWLEANIVSQVNDEMDVEGKSKQEEKSVKVDPMWNEKNLIEYYTSGVILDISNTKLKISSEEKAKIDKYTFYCRNLLRFSARKIQGFIEDLVNNSSLIRKTWNDILSWIMNLRSLDIVMKSRDWVVMWNNSDEMWITKNIRGTSISRILLNIELIEKIAEKNNVSPLYVISDVFLHEFMHQIDVSVNDEWSDFREYEIDVWKSRRPVPLHEVFTELFSSIFQLYAWDNKFQEAYTEAKILGMTSDSALKHLNNSYTEITDKVEFIEFVQTVWIEKLFEIYLKWDIDWLLDLFEKVTWDKVNFFRLFPKAQK